MSNTTCPKCKFSDHLEDILYCQECGTLLINQCTNQNCDTNISDCDDYIYIPDNAKYCPYCGYETTYKQQGFFE